MPKAVAQWSLTSLREKLIKIGAKVVSHGRYVTFQLAEVAVPRQMFQGQLPAETLARRRGHCRGGLTGWFYSRVDDDQRYWAAQAQGVSSARRLLGQLLTSLVSTSLR
jgi:hypothetical protein